SLLLPIACLAVFPFEEAKKLQKLIIHLIRQLQDKLDKSNPKQMSILTEMNAVVQVLNQFKGEIRTSRSQADSAFLRDQVQMNLKNSSQKLLSLQGLHESKPTETADDLPAIDPDISGDISMFSQMDTAQVSPQANPKTPAIDSPSPQQLLSFIQGFDYLS
ncbi:MAG: hypothetical protein HC825_10270, partial [Oscillatoriales cyanobacterium RM1_1_9]|nr:hypothetical protein [Oscillatoriales cyanobacterium RM1_1_9]